MTSPWIKIIFRLLALWFLDDQSRSRVDSLEIEQGKLSSPATPDTSPKEEEDDHSLTPLSHENGQHEISTSVEDIVSEDRLEESSSKEISKDTSLLEAYNLEDNSEEKPSSFSHGIEELNEAAVTKDGRLILDFLQAIHAAEKRQADLDSHLFAEEKRALKEKYEKEVKDAIARELMRAEEAALLNKELKKERAKAAAALKALQQSLEDSHNLKLAQKEAEAESKLKKVVELAKLETAASIAREKAAQIEKVAEANLHINALCMAFFARSEEARRSHSIHKLSLGALALEDALDKGLPIKAEIEALQRYLEGIEKDSPLDLVLSSLPEETILHGSDTVLQLNQQFDTLKGTLRHFQPNSSWWRRHFSSLFGICSFLDKDQRGRTSRGDDIESTIKKVEKLLAEGNLAEAADALEEGVRAAKQLK
ncbi:hypothetical protein MLD38_019509 [Melastoma candidum]|uniref:Uncharacterized protein n=1 Tax=Melastoma candidum TaxID=119954 RepID=A0ACB9QX55_9MYRT|nr:hypothetical protein MLD38_019509 [Melastoma candidum]